MNARLFRSAGALFGSIVALALGLFTVLGGSSSAAAQVSCDPEVTEYLVASAVELNAAIRCHNQSANERTQVFLLDDIVAETVAGDSVFERVTRGTIIIYGQPNYPDVVESFTLSRGPTAGTALLPLLAGDPGVELWVVRATLDFRPL